jgi:uncharacterized membrane-anchored protein
MLNQMAVIDLPRETTNSAFKQLLALAMRFFAMTFVILLLCTEASIAQQDDTLQKLNALSWVRAPQSVVIGNKAQLTLSNDLQFLSPPDSDTFIQLQGNPPSRDISVLSKRDGNWFAVFYFDPGGYVKDDEKLDPDSLLKSLQENNVRGAEKRKRLNLTALTLVGWYTPPSYDPQTHFLEWGTRLRSDDNTETVNYTVRLLGRGGVMQATLVSSPATFDADVREFKGALQSFSFLPGETYAEFRQGDKIAEYGLAALVTGGAVAVAAKAGGAFFKAIALGMLAAVAAALSFIKNLFTGKK